MWLTMLTTLQSQNETTKVLDSLSFYGSLRVQAASFDGDTELQENSPRIGVNIARDVNAHTKIFAKLEYGIHIIDGVDFNNDASTSTEFLANPQIKKEPFKSRLAYVGLSHKKWGILTVGKQWGVYYDIAGLTDNFSVFGGNSNGIYTGNTDGGWKGTGRADKSIQYRNQFGKLKIGLQTQLYRAFKNYGASLQYRLFPSTIVGVAYNNGGITKQNQVFIQDIGKRTENVVVGVKYKRKKLYGALTYSVNEDEILVLNDSTAISFPTRGSELLIRYNLTKKWVFEGGFNLSEKTKSSVSYKDDYSLKHYILGINYYLDPKTRIYLDARISDSKGVSFNNTINVITLGFRYSFDFGL